jgi:hypothetical protein
MTKRATVDDFPIGCTVKVVRLPRHARNPELKAALWEIGRVTNVYDDLYGQGPYVSVDFGPYCPDYPVPCFRPWWLERGRVEWIKDEVSE